jgi:predicted dehydrogenase
MRKLKAGVIGLGVGNQHARTYVECEFSDLHILCDMDQNKLIQAQKDYPNITTTEKWKDVCHSKDIDVISIASYDNYHSEQIISALQSGKHVFVEKPICQTHDELDAIYKAWSNAGNLSLSVNLVLRGADLYKELKTLIANDFFGEIYAFDADYLYGRLHKITEGWRAEIPYYSTLQGGGIHMLDLIIWLLGELPTEVHGTGNKIASKGSIFKYNDYSLTTYSFGSGIIARISSNFGSVHKHHHILRIFGTKGTFIYDDQGPRYYRSRDSHEQPIRIDKNPLPDKKGILIPAWLNNICMNDIKKSEAIKHLNVMRACLAGDESIAKKKSIQINYF